MNPSSYGEGFCVHSGLSFTRVREVKQQHLSEYNKVTPILNIREGVIAIKELFAFLAFPVNSRRYNCKENNDKSNHGYSIFYCIVIHGKVCHDHCR